MDTLLIFLFGEKGAGVIDPIHRNKKDRKFSILPISIAANSPSYGWHVAVYPLGNVLEHLRHASPNPTTEIHLPVVRNGGALAFVSQVRKRREDFPLAPGIWGDSDL